MSQAEALPTNAVAARDYSHIDRRMHWIFLIFSIVVVVSSMTMRIKEETRVTIPGTDVLVPELCMMKVMSGFPCAGCGMTRSFISLGHGDLMASWNYNPGGIVLFALIAFQIPYRILQLRRMKLHLPKLNWGLGMVAVLILAVALGYARWLAQLMSYWL